VKIVDGARRVRILGLDLSRNKASTTGSFEITGFSDGDINISANNLQQPSTTSARPNCPPRTATPRSIRPS
jgi:type II secretory pathway component PulC